MPRLQDPALRRYARWALLVRWVGKLLCRIKTAPPTLPDTFGRPSLMIANHRSLADVFVAVDILDRFEVRARFLVRKSYFDIPLAGRWLRSVGAIPAGDGKRGAFDIAIETLKGGRAVAVMVEGRITPPEQRDEQGIGPFRPGFIEIARATDAVITPIAIVGTDDVWRSRGRFPRIPWRGRPLVTVTVGEPVVIDDLTDDEAFAASRAAMAELIAAS